VPWCHMPHARPCVGVFKSQITTDLSIFDNNFPQNGFKNEETAPRTRTGYPHEGSSVDHGSCSTDPTEPLVPQTRRNNLNNSNTSVNTPLWYLCHGFIHVGVSINAYTRLETNTSACR
jgi:hypothetical protein